MQYILQEEEYKKLMSRETFDKAFGEFINELLKLGKPTMEYDSISLKQTDLKSIVGKLENAIKQPK
jgi:hypothetical protein